MKSVSPNIEALSPSQSIKYVKGLLKGAKSIKQKDFKPGNILMMHYNAKDKTETYDRTPLIFVLKRNRTHTMAINFHWAPVPLRIVLVKKIIQKNRGNIKKKKPMVFDYNDLKPFLKKIGFAPVIRMYINKRISNKGVVIPQEEFLTIARTRTETFTQGKVSAEFLYNKAIKGNKKYRRTRKRRE